MRGILVAYWRLVLLAATAAAVVVHKAAFDGQDPGRTVLFLLLVSVLLAALPVGVGIARAAKRPAPPWVVAALSGAAAGGAAALCAYLPLRNAGAASAPLLATLFLVIGVWCSARTLLWWRALARQRALGAGRDVDFISSSALSDGRVVGLAEAGILRRRLVVAAPVDARGKHFLIELRKAQPDLEEVGEEGVPPAEARLVTCNSQEASTHRASGGCVLDVATLAGSVCGQLRRGERLTLKLSQLGTQPNQAVGFLDDGTPVVVAMAAGRIGDTVQVEVVRYLERSSGRIAFAELIRG